MGFGDPHPEEELKLGPNITEWPEIPALKENLVLELASVLRDPVTTTDELIPSGDTSSYRSNPLKLATFALSRRDPMYVGRANAIAEKGKGEPDGELLANYEKLGVTDIKNTAYASAIFANRPGDGSAREQAASCQRVLGGAANICYEYATKRYRSNCVNWGMLPFNIDENTDFPYEAGDLIYVPGVRKAVEAGARELNAKVLSGGKVTDITLKLPELTQKEREIILEGCLMNWYSANRKRG